MAAGVCRLRKRRPTERFGAFSRVNMVERRDGMPMELIEREIDVNSEN
jgi:hypothetical protein